MLVLTAKIIFIGSILGMSTILIQKIPVLKSLSIPKKNIKEKEKISLFLIFRKIGEIIKNFWFFLKRKIFLDLKDLKKYSKKEKTELSDDYWDKLKRD